MDQQTIHTLHKTYKEKLRPTPAQERALEDVLWRCRELYNTALEQRITAWQRRRVSLSRYEQEVELKAIRAAFEQRLWRRWRVFQRAGLCVQSRQRQQAQRHALATARLRPGE